MGNLVLAGSTSGSTTLTPTDAVTATLTLPSSTGTILTTANPQSGGVIQVVNSTYSVATSNNTASPIDTGLTATITPKFSTSKILVLIDQSDVYSGSGVGVKLTLLRNGTTLFSFTEYASYSGSLTIDVGSASCNYLDSPATTSAVTYKTQFVRITGSSIVYVQNGAGAAGSTITLMEIAA